ncbi:serine/threonine protein kinase [Paenibacillus sp. FSL R5-0636]|uniref:serine/threonine protein kinase n=1 Tax=Paenibacillus sp. FSL R5-0636 TaxID=2921652 RepID=UPI00096EE9C2|nr:serine/threonine protein kinase [Paenibacillus odorifer]OMC99004.1 serine/threonine protein kinase [Paenibacillus odorifer]
MQEVNLREKNYTYEIDAVTFQLQEACDFAWLTKLGKVFKVFDQQDSGNFSFGVEQDGKKFFVKFAGARPLTYAGNPQDAVNRLIEAIPLYNELRSDALITLLSHYEVESGYVAVFDWFAGECLHSHWLFAGEAKLSHPESPFFRYKQLSVEKRLSSLDVIFLFHEHVEYRGYVAVDFYDGSILYDFVNDGTKICDIDYYRLKPTVNDLGENFWGSSRFKSPEEFSLDAPIDEVTNVFNMGATAFVLLGGASDRSFAKWETSQALYEVALRAVSAVREQRYRNVAEFKLAWDAAKNV